MTPEEILNDFRRRYENTFVFVKEPSSDERNLFFVDRIEGATGKMGILHLSSPEVGRIRLNIGSAHTIQFVPPPVGVFQYEKQALVCRRRPQKQYRRGICQENTFIAPTVWNVHPMFADAFAISHEVVQAAFDRKTYHIKDAIELLSTNKFRSIALRDNFSLSLPFSTVEEYVLFYWEAPVAKIKKDGTILRVMEAVLEKQINQVLS